MATEHQYLTGLEREALDEVGLSTVDLSTIDGYRAVMLTLLTAKAVGGEPWLVSALRRCIAKTKSLRQQTRQAAAGHAGGRAREV